MDQARILDRGGWKSNRTKNALIDLEAWMDLFTFNHFYLHFFLPLFTGNIPCILMGNSFRFIMAIFIRPQECWQKIFQGGGGRHQNSSSGWVTV